MLGVMCIKFYAVDFCYDSESDVQSSGLSVNLDILYQGVLMLLYCTLVGFKDVNSYNLCIEASIHTKAPVLTIHQNRSSFLVGSDRSVAVA